ncbi:hypothetical protein MG293_001896 [Ovis ammon polii]|uniref:Uncharacterized protein n=1 Tax=Ovis ammon polii TaxID=230172 RepID=A0AAD4YJF4_OVIAM|nr:hypothetical protein MG293_001896 [Ovis ammon polii]
MLLLLAPSHPTQHLPSSYQAFLKSSGTRLINGLLVYASVIVIFVNVGLRYVSNPRDVATVKCHKHQGPEPVKMLDPGNVPFCENESRPWPLEHVGFSSCGTCTQLLQAMWNPPRPGIEPMSPTLTGLDWVEWGKSGGRETKEKAAPGVPVKEAKAHIHGLPNTETVQKKAMAPHSSTLAWKIPWAEEPGRLQSMGSLRVGHD